MFESLTGKLQEAFRELTGRGTLSEKNIEDAMRQVRLALLDADVNYKVVKEFVEQVRQDCLGEKVLKSVTPGQQAIKVVYDRLKALLGEANVPLNLEGGPAILMLVGLHGGGKTTTVAKLAALLRKKNRRILLVAGDVYRPAAIDQLEILGQQVGVPVYADRSTQDVAAICEAARQRARAEQLDTIIIDTAGRLQIDETLVGELIRVRDAVVPQEILLVADAALGQEAVSVATHFDQALNLTGIILTKLDGDARGGAALSMRQVTGKPIKLIGVGEKIEDLESFNPEGMASRILGMGDVVSLVEKAAEAISEEEAQRLEQKVMENRFDLQDFLNQLRSLQKLGGMARVLDLIPGGHQLTQGADLDENRLHQVEAVILSMTPYERANPEVLHLLSRRQRIARGSGRPLLEVQELLKRFEVMRNMMAKWGKLSKAVESGRASGGGGGSAGGRGGVRTLSQKQKKAMRKKHRRQR